MMLVTFCALLFGLAVVSTFYKQGQYKKIMYSTAIVLAVMLVISFLAGLVLPDSHTMLVAFTDFLESHQVVAPEW